MKVILFITGFISTSLSVFAQTLFIKGGVNISSLAFPSSQVSIPNTTQTDFHLGLGVATELANKLVFQFSAGYSRLAVNPISTSGFLQGTAVLKYHPNKEFNFHLGPYAGVPISIDSGLGVDYGLIPGIEYYFTKNIGMGVSYLYGLGESEVKTRAFQFSLIFRFKSLQLKNAGY